MQICKVKTLLPKPWKTSVLPQGALLDHNDKGTIQRFFLGAVQQLKLLPRGNTSHFLRPRVDVSSYYNGPKQIKRTWLRTDVKLRNCTSTGQKFWKMLPTVDKNLKRWDLKSVRPPTLSLGGDPLLVFHIKGTVYLTTKWDTLTTQMIIHLTKTFQMLIARKSYSIILNWKKTCVENTWAMCGECEEKRHSTSWLK